MKGFILCAGLGERLRPLTSIMPKPLVPVMNVPAVCYAVAMIKEAGIREVIVNLHYKPEMIKDFFSANHNFGLEVEFSYEPEILGTGGGLKKCEQSLHGEPFAIVNSDVICDLSIPELISVDFAGSEPRLRPGTANSGSEPMRPGTELSGSEPQLLAETGISGVRATSASGNRINGVRACISTVRHASGATVSTDGDLVLDFRNFLHTDIPPVLDYAGIAVMPPELLDYLSPENTSVVYTGYTSLAEQKKLFHREHTGLWADIGSLESFRLANLAVMNNRKLIDRVKKYTGFVPSAIDAAAEIGEGASVTNSVIAAGCRIGRGSSVINSVLLPGASVGDGLIIKDRVLLKDQV